MFGEDRYRHLFEATGCLVVVLTKDFDIVDFNPMAEQVYGVKRNEVIGRNYIDFFVTEKNKVHVKKEFIRAINGKKSSQYENTLNVKKGVEKIISWNVNALRNPRGDVEGLIAVGQDITSYKLLYNSLVENEKKFRTLFHISPSSSVLTDLDGNILECNEKFIELHGIQGTTQEQIGVNVSRYFPKEELPRLLEGMKKTFDEGVRQKPRQYTMLKVDGTSFKAEVTSYLIYGDDGEPVGRIAQATECT